MRFSGSFLFYRTSEEGQQRAVCPLFVRYGVKIPRFPYSEQRGKAGLSFYALARFCGVANKSSIISAAAACADLML